MLYTHVLSLTHLHTYPIPKSRSLSQNMYMRRSLLYYCSAVNLSMWIEPEELINTERPLRKRKPTSIFYPRSCRTNYPWNPAAVFLRFITVWLYCSAVVSINFKCQSLLLSKTLSEPTTGNGRVCIKIKSNHSLVLKCQITPLPYHFRFVLPIGI